MSQFLSQPLVQGYGGLGIDASAAAVIAAMTTPPTAARQAIINNLVISLKAAGVWPLLDILYVLAAADSQAAGLNWKNPAAFALTAVNSPTFTADRGYAGDGSTSYVDTTYNPSTDGVQFTLNAAHIMAWNRTNRAANTAALISGNSGGIAIFPFFTAAGCFGRINDASGPVTTPGSNGMFIANRSASNAKEVFRDGASLGSAADAALALDSLSIFIGAANVAGVPTSFSSDEVASASLGGNLAGRTAAYYTALQTYMTAVGA